MSQCWETREGPARPVVAARLVDAVETGDAERPKATARPIVAARPVDAVETGDAAETGDTENHLPLYPHRYRSLTKMPLTTTTLDLILTSCFDLQLNLSFKSTKFVLLPNV